MLPHWPGGGGRPAGEQRCGQEGVREAGAAASKDGTTPGGGEGDESGNPIPSRQGLCMCACGPWRAAWRCPTIVWLAVAPTLALRLFARALGRRRGGRAWAAFGCAWTERRTARVCVGGRTIHLALVCLALRSAWMCRGCFYTWFYARGPFNIFCIILICFPKLAGW